MLQRQKNWIHNRVRQRVKRYFELYDIEDLTIGGHCGLCGAWVDGEILPEDWAWTICNLCLVRYGEYSYEDIYRILSHQQEERYKDESNN